MKLMIITKDSPNLHQKNDLENCHDNIHVDIRPFTPLGPGGPEGSGVLFSPYWPPKMKCLDA